MTVMRAARLLLGAILIAVPAGLSAAESWIVLPDPDVSSLEPQVAKQLREYREIAVAAVANPEIGPDELAAAIGELGRYYHTYQLRAAAEECYTIARRLTPQDFRWHYFLGYLYQNAGRLEEAEAGYLGALEIHRAAPPALLRLAEVYVELNRLEAAASLMREARALDSSSAAARAALGELYQQMGRIEEAIELLESALEQVPDANRLYYPLALAYRGLGETDRARELMAKRGKVGLKPADPLIDSLDELRIGERVFLLTGQTAYRAGRFAEAAEAFRKAVEADPESVAARIDLGSALGELGDRDDAIEQFEKAVEIAPGNSTALFNLGLLLADRGDLEEAIDKLRLAAQYDPDDAGIRLRLADMLRFSGHAERALLHYRATAKLDPAEEEAHLGVAQTLVSLGRFREARDWLDEALELIPSSGLLAHAQSRLLAMGPDLVIRDGERALKLAEKVFAARSTPEHAEVVAAALAQIDRCDEAAEWQRLAIETASETDTETRRTVLALYQAGAPCRYPGRGGQKPEGAGSLKEPQDQPDRR